MKDETNGERLKKDIYFHISNLISLSSLVNVQGGG
jgi:hypothetical protein